MSNGWRMADLPPPRDGAAKVFSCFHCGGGSTLGYKLAGCDVLGGVEIDPAMAELYRANFKPKISQVCDIRVADVPSVAVDILDGSPPCTPFSTAGLREKSWGQTKSFAEGGSTQTLDDLFFAFIEYAAKVNARAVIAENVSGMLRGNARAYVQRVNEGFKRLGYTAQLFHLAAADFGVPQIRRRVFFIAHRSKRAVHIAGASAKQQHVTISEALVGVDPLGKPLGPASAKRWPATPLGGKYAHGSYYRLNPKAVTPTLTTNTEFTHWDHPRRLSDAAYARVQSFPDDYSLRGRPAEYVFGMSVAPFVMRAVATALLDVM